MLTFWRHGFESTSISDLTAAIGVTAPSIYTAFGDKKRLFLEAVQLYAGPREELQRKLDAADTARDAVQDMLRSAACGFTGETTPRGCLLASATASVSIGAEDMQRAVADVRRDILARLTGRISRDVSSGVLPPETDAAALAAMVIAVIQGMSVLACDGMERDRLLLVADCAMRTWPDRNDSLYPPRT